MTSQSSDTDKPNGWTQAERDGIRNLLKMGLILLCAIIVAGGVAAFLSSTLGTL